MIERNQPRPPKLCLKIRRELATIVDAASWIDRPIENQIIGIVRSRQADWPQTWEGDFKPIDDFSTGWLPSQERREARDIYQDLIRILPHLGFAEDEITQGISPNVRKPVIINGIGEDFRIGISDIRDSGNGYIQLGKRIYIDRIYSDLESEHFILTNDGRIHYAMTREGNKIESYLDMYVKGNHVPELALTGLRITANLLTTVVWNYVLNKSPKP